jgi:hypothetical protein
VRDDILANDRRDMPGLVRISFGMYNTAAEVDVIVDALKAIAQGKYAGRYEQDAKTGEYRAVEWNPDLAQYFKL